MGTQSILNLTVVVEPDRQRLARFGLDAVQTLGGNVFTATALLTGALARLRADGAASGMPVDAQLWIDDGRLCLGWGTQRATLAAFTPPPPAERVTELARRLRLTSEAADPALLKRRNQEINAELERFMHVAAGQMAELEAVLEKKKTELQESIRQAETDSLTGLYNRGAYDQRLRESVLRCQRQHQALALVLLDLDKFKEINDTHGHQYGDEYLKRMAQALRHAVRDHVDYACRMGGDEFAVIAFGDEHVGMRIAEKVLYAMERRVSIGVAVLQPDDTVESLVGRTDAALYEAKRHGRGRFVLAEGGAPAVAGHGAL